MDVVFSNNGQSILRQEIATDCTICARNAATRKSTHSALEGHTELVKSIALSRDSKHIVSGSSDETV